MQLNVQSTRDDMTSAAAEVNICIGCNQAIKDKYLLKAIEQVWHEDCLKCSCCGCRLGEVGSSLFVKANLLLCKRDYFRLFGMPGHCSACLLPIPSFEMVMRAKEHVYHIECFACYKCRLRFCVGDKFYLFGSKIVCEDHYEVVEGKDNLEESLQLHDKTVRSHAQLEQLQICKNSDRTAAEEQCSEQRRVEEMVDTVNTRTSSFSS